MDSYVRSAERKQTPAALYGPAFYITPAHVRAGVLQIIADAGRNSAYVCGLLAVSLRGPTSTGSVFLNDLAVFLPNLYKFTMYIKNT